MTTLLSISITFFTIIAGLATLFTALCSACYTNRPPHGDGAMGLIVPFATAAIAALALLIAGALAGYRGALDWLVASRGVGSLIMAIAGLLVGGTVFGALIGWCENHPWANVLTLNLAGVVLPALFLIFLISCAWVDQPKFRDSVFKVFSLTTAAAPALGILVALLGLKAYFHHNAQRNAWAAEAHAKEAAEQARRDAMTPEQRLLEDLERYSPTQPLWTLVAGLPDEPSQSLRNIWIERALKHPNFDNELQGTLTCDYAVYRHGCVILLIEMPEDRIKPAQYAQWLANDAKQTAADIREHGLAKRKHNDFSQHAANITKAAQRVTMTDELRDSLADLRDAVEHPATASTTTNK
ncbi:MAG TPA: hypothetical protein VK157_10270 [Phycisphaerales bacterium]|nr:hypothetical protein [Phycisphaerales bacterium]